MSAKSRIIMEFAQLDALEDIDVCKVQDNPGSSHPSASPGAPRYRKPSIWIPLTKYRWVKMKSRTTGSTAATPVAI